MEQRVTIGLPSYEEADFKEIVAMLPPTERVAVPIFATFKAKLAESEHEAQRDRQFTIRVPIRAAGFQTWCREKQLSICRRTLFEYESELITTALTAQR